MRIRSVDGICCSSTRFFGVRENRPSRTGVTGYTLGWVPLGMWVLVPTRGQVVLESDKASCCSHDTLADRDDAECGTIHVHLLSWAQWSPPSPVPCVVASCRSYGERRVQSHVQSNGQTHVQSTCTRTDCQNLEDSRIYERTVSLNQLCRNSTVSLG